MGEETQDKTSVQARRSPHRAHKRSRRRGKSVLIVAILIGTATIAFPMPESAQAESKQVPCSVPALVAAINNANSTAAADILNLTRDCTYRLTAPNNAANGLPVISATITINGNEATITRDSSAPSFRILTVGTTGVLTLNNTTISGGRVSDCPTFPGICGGGINSDGRLTVNASRVINNTATGNNFIQGAGINGEGSMTTITGTEISGNIASYTGTAVNAALGAGIANDGPLTVENCRITNNRSTVTANTGSFAQGAALEPFAPTTIRKSVIGDNVSNAPGGTARGALAVSATTVDVSDTKLLHNGVRAANGTVTGGAIAVGPTSTTHLTAIIVSENHADAPGGVAIAGGMQVAPDANVTVTKSALLGNTVSAVGGTSAHGGGLNNEGKVTLTTTAVLRNTASGSAAKGGGLYNTSGATATLTLTVVTGNKAGDGGGIFNDGGSVALDKSSVAGNTPNNCRPPASVPGCTG